MSTATTIERPEGLRVPERRDLAALFAGAPEIRDAGDGKGWTFEGHAAVWKRLSVDLGGFRERIQRGAFADVLASADLDVAFVVDHDLGALATLATTRGGTLALAEDGKGLHVRASVAPTSAGDDVRALVKRGDVQGMSFGFRVAEGGDTWATEGGEYVRTIHRIGRLFDVTVTGFPAYSDTDAEARSVPLLLERRSRLDLYDPASGELDPEKVRRLRAQVQARAVELSEPQRALLDHAADLVHPPGVDLLRRRLRLRDLEVRHGFAGDVRIGA